MTAAAASSMKDDEVVNEIRREDNGDLCKEKSIESNNGVLVKEEGGESPSTTKKNLHEHATTAVDHVSTSSVNERQTTNTKTKKTTSMFVIRHGDRWDYSHPDWKTTTTRPGDPSLSDLGFQQARETGAHLAQLLEDEQFDQLIVLVSPFLRTIQTANEIVSQLEQTIYYKEDRSRYIPLKLECSVWEIDGDDPNVMHHMSLPSPNGKDMNYIKQERYPYFPRIDMLYESMFIPSLPELKLESLPRLERAIAGIEKRFVKPFSGVVEQEEASVVNNNDNTNTNTTPDDNTNITPDAVLLPLPGNEDKEDDDNKRVPKKQAIIVVTHAAACIGLTKAAAKCSLDEINPAGPCSIFRLDFVEQKWKLDHYSRPETNNGFMGHVSEWGTTTIPWNNFGSRLDEDSQYYTGPPRNEIEHLFEQSPPAEWY